MSEDQSAIEKAHSLLCALAETLPQALVSRSWFILGHGFGLDVYADYRDAEFHLRALYRILGTNVPVYKETH